MRHWVVVIIGLACSGCWPFPTGPSESLAGGWQGVTSPGKVGVAMCLQHAGNVITGHATASSGGVEYFADAPVSGTFPRVDFVVTPESIRCCPQMAGQTYSGRFDEKSGVIEGRWGMVDLSLGRTGLACAR